MKIKLIDGSEFNSLPNEAEMAKQVSEIDTNGGYLDLSGYAHALPALTSVGGSLIESAPFIPQIHKRIYDAAKADDRFDMHEWGRDTPCGTGRCRGGHTVNLAGKKGFELKSRVDWSVAALLIYMKSDPDLWRKGYPDFSSSVKNADALADMKRCAELEESTQA